MSSNELFEPDWESSKPTISELRKLGFKRDRFFREPGGTTKHVEVLCRHCGSSICVYQKDGPGKKLRLYLDRFVWPLNFQSLINTESNLTLSSLKKVFPVLRCPNSNCLEVIALPMLCEKNNENRLTFRIKEHPAKSK